ncbi:WD domain-containing protein [Nannizzia gypsea CBS 118893]|uniref:WD domain-containing protein n=1 Tax=Arthroderma gypseum (strain ATCC MYA-4604 / CBS 118893) TaxID=535722 RepID=E5R2S9_ARTGP|nr:WD domain-containing protein [Nannizzia gypsea CBS 118893]EFQ97063.1 WD domain-containing protein [Nannizzia gypsea CBS 118893]
MSSEHYGVRVSTSSGSRSASGALLASPPIELNNDLSPCAATASLFLFSQGPTVIALHHDSLAVDRRFHRHRDDVQIIAVDNVSERGAGRLVVSYDIGHTAIIWDLFTGQEITRFVSFEPIRVATWLRNGHVAFGNIKGEIILFEPSTSEHISARTIFDPITALAPTMDCNTFAIGYLNGSILIATLLPTFTILHTLTTTRGPSPVISLSWHASSTKQKTDMLASQTIDGDLFVWSVAKQPSTESPRVIRALKKSESNITSPKWLAWSKNGRIVQHNDGESLAWDVRTKNVSYETIPTIQGVQGIANYGPTATLFTMGPNHTIQQYDVANAVMVANTQHIPQKPDLPVEQVPAAESSLTVETLAKHTASEQKHKSRPSQGSLPGVESKLDLVRAEASKSPGSGYSVPISNGSRPRNRTPYAPRPPGSNYSGSATTFSLGSPRPSIAETLHSGYSARYAMSMNSTESTLSKLRTVSIPGIWDDPVTDLFPYIRARLNSVSINPSRRFDDPNLGPDELRRQMLTVIFGWEGNIEDLIRSEFKQHTYGSQHSAILARWLLTSEADIMAPMVEASTSSYVNWMIMALSLLTKKEASKEPGQALAKKLLASNDTHAAAAVLMGIGEGDLAVELYVSKNQFMEAVLLSCLLTPAAWSRQSYLIRKWGEHAAINSQQHLALRCFSCTETANPVSWKGPTSHPSGSNPPSEKNQGAPLNGPPLNNLSPTSRLKNQSLRLITSFGSNSNSTFQFPGLASADRTPTNMPGVTPIDAGLGDQMFSPGGFNSGLRPGSHRGQGATPVSRTHPASFGRERLPSIGESPNDPTPTVAAPRGRIPVDQSSESDKEIKVIDVPLVPPPASNLNPTTTESLEYLTPARYTPLNESMKEKETPMTAVPPDRTMSSSSGRENKLENSLGQNQRSSNGSQSRKPDGLQIQWPPVDDQSSEDQPSEESYYQQPSSNRRNGERADGVMSPTTSTRSARSGASVPLSAKSLDKYISSLDGASYHSQRQKPHKKSGSRASSKDPNGRGRSKQRYIQPAKKSPSSPIPMSPEDIALYSSSSRDYIGVQPPSRNGRKSSRMRSNSPGGRSRVSGRSTSRRRDFDYSLRSPTSPVPMSPAESSGDTDRRFRLLNAERKQRYKSRERSANRRHDRSRSAPRHSLSEQRNGTEKDSDTSGELTNRSDPVHPTYNSSDDQCQPQLFSHNQIDNQLDEYGRKRSAAAELEARRQSLARRPSAPPIPLPGEASLNQILSGRPSPSPGPQTHGRSNSSFSQRAMSKSTGPTPSSLNERVPFTMPIGLPATPRAMRHPKYSTGYNDSEAPEVPEVPPPDSFYNYERRPSFNIPRSMSAPIPAEDGIPTHPHFQRQLPSSRINRTPGHKREPSNEGITLENSRVENLRAEHSRITSGPLPPLLPELQHLHATATPPPPPPPPAPPSRQPPPPAAPVQNDGPTHDEGRNSLISGVGTINIAIDDSHSPGLFGPPNPNPNFRAASLPAHQQSLHQLEGNMRASADPHKRGRSVNDNVQFKFRNLTDRMRSSSRPRNGRSPASDRQDVCSPYESLATNGPIENRI